MLFHKWWRLFLTSNIKLHLFNSDTLDQFTNNYLNSNNNYIYRYITNLTSLIRSCDHCSKRIIFLTRQPIHHVFRITWSIIEVILQHKIIWNSKYITVDSQIKDNSCLETTLHTCITSPNPIQSYYCVLIKAYSTVFVPF